MPLGVAAQARQQTELLIGTKSHGGKRKPRAIMHVL